MDSRVAPGLKTLSNQKDVMNYQRMHDALIERSRSRTYDKSVHQLHHVVPRHEDNTSTEVVPLTFKEHKVIHLLRWRITGTAGNKMAYILMKSQSDEAHRMKASLGGIFGGRETKDRSSGIFSPDWDRSSFTKSLWENGILSKENFADYRENDGNRRAGYASVASGKGIHAEDYDRSSVSKRIWDDLTVDEYETRCARNKEYSAKGGQISKEMGTNFSSWDPGKRRSTAAAGGRIVGKIPMWTNGTLNKRSLVQPGPEWRRGYVRKQKGNVK